MEPQASTRALTPDRATATPRAAAQVPVTVIAGFLGSGKTTLLNRLLVADHGLRLAVIVNDFGSINIDAKLIAARDATTISLDNGCICCSVAGDLVARLTGLLERPDHPDHVVIETSGVSDPGRILRALADPHLRTLARVDAVITLVDAANADAIPDGHLELARRQLASADLIVFNKADLVSRREMRDLRERMTYPRARVLEAVDAEIPAEMLFDGSLGHDPLRHTDEPLTMGHAQASRWAWRSDLPLDLQAVRRLLASLPTTIYRAKGLLLVADAPTVRVVAHVVGRRVDLRPGGGWDGAPGRTEFVFLSLGAPIDEDLLSRRLAACVAPNAFGQVDGMSAA